MNEAIGVDGDADMQFLVRQVHEDEIAPLQLAERHRHSGAELFLGRARHANAGAAGRIGHQSAAVEPAGRGAAEAILLADHGDGEIDHDGPWIRGRRSGAR